MEMRTAISRSVLIGIRRISADAAPLEACGLLFGDEHGIADFKAVRNVAAHPGTHFEIDPAALFAALKAERAGGPKLIGYWHSHPGGDAMPSATDAAMAHPDAKLWLIVGGETVTAWRTGESGLHGRFEPVALDLDL